MVDLTNGMGAAAGTWVPFSRVREGTLRQDGGFNEWDGSSRFMGTIQQGERGYLEAAWWV